MTPEPPGELVLVTGPARSGKSEWAERLAASSGRPTIYIATAREDPADAEWSARILAHRRRRPADWTTVCAPLALEDAILAWGQPANCLLIDSLGTWCANLLDVDEDAWRERVRRLRATLAATPALGVLVAEETGWGVIPAYASGRRFRDRLGTLTRQLGQQCTRVYLVTGGYAIDLARLGERVDAG